MSNSSIQVLALQPPDTPYSIRPVDIQDLHTLHLNFWQERTIDQCRTYLKRVLNASQKEHGLGIVVLDGDTIVAYGQVLSLTRCMEISDLFVQPSYRSQGIGTAMIQYLCTSMLKLSTLPIQIGVALSNPCALALYKHLGFTHKNYLELNLGDGIETVQYLEIIPDQQ
ncbi:MAG: GNAT family N-acetyltransferase [Chloroflexota bacterium]